MCYNYQKLELWLEHLLLNQVLGFQQDLALFCHCPQVPNHVSDVFALRTFLCWVNSLNWHQEPFIFPGPGNIKRWEGYLPNIWGIRFGMCWLLKLKVFHFVPWHQGWISPYQIRQFIALLGFPVALDHWPPNFRLSFDPESCHWCHSCQIF